MSLCQWNTSFEHKQLAKKTTSLALYQVNNGSSDMEEEVMSGSSSSSGTSSSSSLSSSSSASDMDLDQTTLINPVLLKLIVTTTLNKKINHTVSDGGISWGCTPTITDLSESDAVENGRLCKVDLRTLTEKLWPLMLVHLTVPFPFQVIGVEVQFLFLCSCLPFSSYLLLIVCTVVVSAVFPEASPVDLHFVASLLPPLSRHYQCFCVWMCCYFCSKSVQS